MALADEPAFWLRVPGGVVVNGQEVIRFEAKDFPSVEDIESSETERRGFLSRVLDAWRG